MKAIVQHGYGSPDLLRMEEVEQPQPQPGHVVVRVRASSVNSWDWERLQGTPFVNRMMYGLTKPRPNSRILGADVAGEIEAVGAGVTRLRPGDQVFGDLSEAGWGGFAEYVLAPETAVFPKPANLDHEQAAAVPQAAVLAFNGLQKGAIAAGQHVLINGAGGGVGTFAIQLAKWYGAEVTGVDVGEKLEVMVSSGADHVVDFTREDFTAGGRSYDLILDVAAHRSPLAPAGALTRGGSYVVLGGSMGRILQTVVLRPWVSSTKGRRIGLLVNKPNTNMDLVTQLLEAGTIRPVIDRVYALEDVPEALRYFGSGRVRGKVVIRV